MNLYHLPARAATNGAATNGATTNGNAALARSSDDGDHHVRGDGATRSPRLLAPARNVGATHLDPYAVVEKRSLWTTDSMRSAGHSVRIADPEAPSGWTECGVMSADYLTVSNAEVRDVAHEIASRSGLRFSEVQTYFDGRRYALTMATTEDGLVEARVGDYVGLGLRAENSYDGSRRFGISLCAYRLACLNGLLVPSLFRRVTFKHLRASAGWEDDVRAALAVIEAAPEGLTRFAEASRALASMRVSAGRLREVRTEVLPKLPVTLWGRTVDRFLEHEALDGFGLLNAATHVLWHDERQTASNARWNEYASTALVRYGLGESQRA